MPTHSHNSHNFRKTQFSTRSSTFIRLYKASMLVHAQFFISILSIQSEQNASIASTQVSTKSFLEKTCSYTISSQARGSLLAHRSSFSSRTELRIGSSIEIFLVVQYTSHPFVFCEFVNFYISQRNSEIQRLIFKYGPFLCIFLRT